MHRKVNYAYGGINKKKNYPFIALPENQHGRRIHTIVHEIAHTLCAPVDSKNAHGPRFCRTLLQLMREFEGREYATKLEAKLRRNKAIR